MIPALVLASGSSARLRLLRNVGLDPLVDVAAVDEDLLKEQARTQGLDVIETAVELATAKACAVAASHPGALVLGADQMLECAGDWFDKPETRARARTQLQALRGRSHRLISAVVAVSGDTVIWQTAQAAQLTMRNFDDTELDAYLDACGEGILGSVGAYHVEGRGAILFERIEGDHFVIQGLPLLALLAFLRTQGML